MVKADFIKPKVELVKQLFYGIIVQLLLSINNIWTLRANP